MGGDLGSNPAYNQAMSIESPTWERGAERQMGHAYTKVTIRNRGDEVLFERGQLVEDQIRSVTLNRALVDTGATMLCLPASTIAALGLAFLKELPVRTAVGTRTRRVLQDAKLTVEGRTSTFDCLELPADAQPLLGVLPLENLGIEPDSVNHCLMLLPEEPGGETHYLLLGPLLTIDDE